MFYIKIRYILFIDFKLIKNSEKINKAIIKKG